MVMNPSSSTYSFQWTCQDPEAPPEQVAAFCHTERGRIQPGKQAEVGAEIQALDLLVLVTKACLGVLPL